MQQRVKSGRRRSPEEFAAWQQAQRDRQRARLDRRLTKHGLTVEQVTAADAPTDPIGRRLARWARHQLAKMKGRLHNQQQRFDRRQARLAGPVVETTTDPTEPAPTPPPPPAGDPYADAAHSDDGAATPGWGGASTSSGGGYDTAAVWEGDTPDAGGEGSGRMKVRTKWLIAGGVGLVAVWLGWRYVTAPYRSISRSIGLGEKFFKSLGAK